MILLIILVGVVCYFIGKHDGRFEHDSQRPYEWTCPTCGVVVHGATSEQRDEFAARHAVDLGIFGCQGPRT